jgi:hypothetical protein
MSTDRVFEANNNVVGNKDDLRALARSVRSAFVIPPDQDQLFKPLIEAIERASEPFPEIGKALLTNLDGLLSAVSIPYTLASRSVFNLHWQRIHTAARIRSLPLDPLPGSTPDAKSETLDNEAQEALALGLAKPEMDKFVNSTVGREILVSETLYFLKSQYDHQPLAGAANELILQGVVLCWGAFEVLARDTFSTYLNVNPGRTLALLDDHVAKRRFDLSKVSLETLAAHNFDLSARMGTLLAEQQDLSDVYSVKAVFQALFPGDGELRDSLNDPDIRLLSLRRNLIVHRRGIIDEKFAASVSCNQELGQRLNVTPRDLEAHIQSTISTATHILDAVSH